MSVKVQKGDGWYKIAKREGIDVNELLKANDATLDTMLHPGQTLKKPGQTETSEGSKKLVSKEKLKMENPMLTKGFPTDALTVKTDYVRAVPRINVSKPVDIKLDPKAIHRERQQALVDAGYNLGTTGENKNGVDGAWGNKSQAAWDLAMKDGYEWSGNKLVRNVTYATPAKLDMMDRFTNSRLSPLYDNMYPYSYGIIQNGDGTVRQVTGNEPKEVQAKAFQDKISAAKKGMSKSRDIMNRMAAVDLSTEEGMAEWQELVKEANTTGGEMVRYRGTTPEQIRNQQWEMRARLDAMNLHQGRPQQYNTFIEQTDKSKLSGAATAAGRPTLIIADPHQRRRINGEMLNYWNAHQNDVVTSPSGYRKLPFMSYLGNASIVQQEDGSLRYADNWDYLTDEWVNYEGRPYFGEVLSDFSGKGYGTGVNSRAFSEGMEDFVDAAKTMVLQSVHDRAADVKDKLKGAADSAFDYVKTVSQSAPRMFTYAAPIMRTRR